MLRFRSRPAGRFRRPFSSLACPTARRGAAGAFPGAAEILEHRTLLTAVDFTAGSIDSHGGRSQDRGGTASVEDGGATLRLTGNTWKSFALDATVTAQTVLAFDFAGPIEGEVQGIGFDTDARLSENRFFALHGTQDWGLRDFADEHSGDGPVSYRIPVGEYFAGEFDRLVFANDHDVRNPDAVSVFSNVRLFEPAPPGSGALNFAALDVASHGGRGQDRSGGASAVDGGAGLRLAGNTWKSVAIAGADGGDYDVTENTVLELTFSATDPGEVAGVGFDTDAGLSENRFFALAGSQNWGNRAFHSNDDGMRTVRIAVGESFTGTFDRLVFAADEDRGGRSADVLYSDVRLFENVTDPPAPGNAVTVSTRNELIAAVNAADPGDTILVAPGEYRGRLFFGGVRGEAGAPITIAAADPGDRPVFTGTGSGSIVQFSRVSHLTLRNLTFAGRTSNGLNIDDGGAENPPSTDVMLEGLHVRDIGSGNRDGIKLSGVDRVTVRGARIERWGTGGSAIDMVGVHDAVVEASLFRHNTSSDRGSVYGNGVQAKGGSSDVLIRGNRFEHAGARAVQIGGLTGAKFFRTPDGGPPTFEAADVTVEHNVIVGSQAAVAFVGSVGGTVRFNTIYRPGRWVFRILQENRKEGFTPASGGLVERNIVVTDSRLATEVNIGSGTDSGSFAFTDNWFFHARQPSRRPNLPGTVAGNVTGVDPQLRDPASGDYRLGADSPAAGYGAG